MRWRARALLLVLALVAAPGSAWATPEEDPRIAAIRANPDDRAESRLLAIAEGDATPDQRAQAAALALEILPYEAGNRVAAPLILGVLRADRSHAEAWQLGYGLRRRVRDGLDVSNGEPFLRAMVELYPEYVRFQYSLGELLFDSGRPAEADAVYEQIVREVPDETRARYMQALLRELEGDAQESLDIYDEIIAKGLDLRAHRYKVKLLWDVLADYEAADQAIDVAFAALDAAPPGRDRDEIRAQIEWDQGLLADRREERGKLAEASARTDRILLALISGWIVVLGGGVAFLRRRRLL